MTGKRPRPESPTDRPITRSKILKSLDDQTDDSISSTSSDTANNSPTSSLNSSSTLEDESATDIVDKDASSGKDPLPEGRAYAPDEVFTEVNGDNPFSSLFPDQKAVLTGALAISSIKSAGVYEFQDVFPINILQAYRPTIALRLLNCVVHRDIKSISSPLGGIINVALADPSLFTFHPKTGYLWSNKNNSWVLSSLVGQTTYFSASHIRQICVRPFTHGWYRFIAVLANVCGHHTIYFQSFRDGITFGTNQFKANGNTTGIALPGKNPKKGKVAPIKGSSLPDGGDIPVFDGREIFSLQTYWDRPYPGEVAVGSTVMLLFSIRKGKLAKDMQTMPNLPEDIKFAVYFSILAIIVLAEPTNQFSDEPSNETPNAFGVDEVRKYATESAETDAVESAGEDEGDYGSEDFYL